MPLFDLSLAVGHAEAHAGHAGMFLDAVGQGLECVVIQRCVFFGDASMALGVSPSGLRASRRTGWATNDGGS